MRHRTKDYRALQPFGQIPGHIEGEFVLFESGAIVFHIAQSYRGLLPADPNGRARAVTWMFAAIGSVEPPILELVTAKFIEGNEPWNAQRLSIIEVRIHKRLGELAERLGEAEWLDGRFSAGDLMIVRVLQRLKPSGIINHHSSLAAYLARGEDRPAYQRAAGA
ncbi:MAG TPA: glutathione S-transferase family protein [Devosia sp.]|nr:glutathione S-transferase family protein [Devosia sp.]